MAEVATRQHTADPATPTGASPHAPEPDGIEAQPELLAGGPVEARPGTALADGRLDPHRQVIVLRALQRTHGNAHVQRLLRERLQQTNARIQREAACPAPPAPAPPLAPKQDPKFQAVKGKVAATAAKEKQHPPAAAKATEAQNAATGPPNEVASQGAAGQVDTMARQEPGAFDKKAFVAAVRQAIERITPKTQEDAADFKSSGKAGQVKDQVTGMVTSGKEGAQKAIKDKTTEPPSPTGAPKPVTPMKAETPGPEPGAVGAASGMPSPKPAAELSLAHGKCETDAMMTDAGVTEPQIKKSNEPEFTGALDAKKKSDVHAATAPQEVKKEEQAALGQAKAGATALAGPAVAGMHSGRAAALTQVGSAKGDTKSQDEAKRAEIATKFEGIYNTTKTEVSAILTGLDAKVNTAFESGEKAARAAFENHVETRMNAYKDKRYGGLDGPALWLVDKLTSMPPEVNVFYVEGRNLYLSQMDGVIDNVAGIVERELGRAKARIAQGKKQIADEVAKLPKSLQAIGREAQQGITGKFEQLEQEVDAKQQALVDDLAQKYVEARNAVDTRIDEMKAANKGLLDYAKDAMGSVVDTITKLKDMLLGVLAKASDVIDTIIADPIQFLSNLVSAIKMGLNQFVGNIGKHLKDGLMGWLLGELASAGITMPKSLDFKGILDLVMQIMGLTYNAIRSRAVKIVGEPVVKKIEQVAEVFKILITEGPAGLWKWIVDKVDNLVDTVLGGIKDLVITKVITAGITWLISLLNPASAFVKACKMIYDVIMFFVERGSQIMSLVNAILDSVGAIASGALGAAANFVEKSLAKALPVAISFLASLLGLGGLSDKIRKIIEQVQKPVGKAVDFVINGVVKAFKKVTGFIGGLFGKKDKDKDKPDERTADQKTAAEKAAVADADKVMSEPEATEASVKGKLPTIKTSHKLDALTLDQDAESTYHVTAMIARTEQTPPKKLGKGVLYEAKAGVLGPDGRPVEEASFSGTQEDVILAVRTRQFGKAKVTAADILGKRNYAMAMIQVSGRTASGIDVVHSFPISNDQLVQIYSSGIGSVPNAELQLPVVDLGGTVLREGSVPTEVKKDAPKLFVSGSVQIVTAEKEELAKFIKEMASILDNRGYVPTLDKHSEEAVWQAVRLYDASIAGKVKDTDLVNIYDFNVSIHSERQMCSVCAAASNFMIGNLASKAPATWDALKTKQREQKEFKRGTTVTSTVEHNQPAPAPRPGETSTTTATPPSGRTKPNEENLDERAGTMTTHTSQQVGSGKKKGGTTG